MSDSALTEISRKVNRLQEDVTWLVNFAKEINPRLSWLEEYAELVPGLQAIVADFRIENERLRNRQNNTAIIFGKVTNINAGANPPRAEIRSTAGNIFIVEIPDDLFDAAALQVDSTIRVEARLKNHTIPKRGTFAIFSATGIEKINSGTVDEKLEDCYNDN